MNETGVSKPLVTRSLQIKLGGAAFEKPLNYFLTVQLCKANDNDDVKGVKTNVKLRTEVCPSTSKPSFTNNVFHLPLPFTIDLSCIAVCVEVHAKHEGPSAEQASLKLGQGVVAVSSIVDRLMQGGDVKYPVNLAPQQQDVNGEEASVTQGAVVGVVMVELRLWQVFGSTREPNHLRYQHQEILCRDQEKVKLTVTVLSCLNAPALTGNYVTIATDPPSEVTGGKGVNPNKTATVQGRHSVWDESFSLECSLSANLLLTLNQPSDECMIDFSLASLKPLQQYNWEVVFPNEVRSRLHVTVTMKEWGHALYADYPTTEKLSVGVTSLKGLLSKGETETLACVFVFHITSHYDEYARRLRLGKGLWPGYPLISTALRKQGEQQDMSELSREVLHRTFCMSAYVPMSNVTTQAKLFPDKAQMQDLDSTLIVEIFVRNFPSQTDSGLFNSFNGMAVPKNPFLGTGSIVQEASVPWKAGDNPLLDHNASTWEFRGHAFISITKLRQLATASVMGLPEKDDGDVEEPQFALPPLSIQPRPRFNGFDQSSPEERPEITLDVKYRVSVEGEDETPPDSFKSHGTSQVHNTVGSARSVHSTNSVHSPSARSVRSARSTHSTHSQAQPSARSVHSTQQTHSTISRASKRDKVDPENIFDVAVAHATNDEDEQQKDNEQGEGKTTKPISKDGKSKEKKKEDEPLPDWLLQDGLSEEDKLKAIRSCGEEIVELRGQVKRLKLIIYEQRSKAVLLDRLEQQIKERHLSAIARLPPNQLANLVFKYAGAYKSQKEDNRLMTLKIEETARDFGKMEKMKQTFAELQGAHIAQNKAMHQLNDKLQKKQAEIDMLMSSSEIGAKLRQYKDTVKTQDILIRSLERVLKETKAKKQMSGDGSEAGVQKRMQALVLSLENQKNMYEGDLESMHLKNIKFESRIKKLEAKLKKGGKGEGSDSDSSLEIDDTETDTGDERNSRTSVSLAPSASLKSLSRSIIARPGDRGSFSSTNL